MLFTGWHSPCSNKAAMKRILTSLLAVPLALAILPDQAMCAKSGIKVKPLYTLSNFTGPVPYNQVRLTVDPANGEIFVLDPKGNDIRIFNRVGMEVHRTGTYRDLGVPLDLAVTKDGGIDLLVRGSGRHLVYRCDYRGKAVSVFEFTGVPESFTRMRSDRILWKNGLLYLADTQSLQVAVFDASGRYQKGYGLADILKLEDGHTGDNSMFGFTVDGEGSLLFTIPTLFSVYRVSAAGKVEVFGEAGSSPGKFSIVSGVAVDNDGHIYLSDRNRSVVMIYSPELKFLHEFGYRGIGPAGLIVPRDLGVDGNGTVYVSQMGSRGIKAFRASLVQ